jgi:ATP-dependent helicase/nuclease subunit B
VKALLLPAGRGLIEEIIPRLAGRDRDYSRNIIVFPGRRPAHFLRKALAGKVGTSFVPPVIFSMDEFVDSVYDRTGSSRKLETIDAVSVLYGIHRKAKNPLGGKGFVTPDSFFPIGLKIYRDIEELAVENVSPHRVKDIQPYTEEMIPSQTMERLQSLAYFYEKFYEAIGEEGFSTRALRYRMAAEKFDEVWKDDRQIIAAGFFALTESEKTLFRKLSSRESAVFIFQEGPGIRERIAGLGLDVEAEECPAVEPEVHFYRSPDSHGQVYGLNRVLEEGGLPADERTAIVLPSPETLFPLLRQGLTAIDERGYNVSLGYPLHRTPVFGFLNNLMELVASMDGDRVYIADYLRFVLHPYTKNIYFGDGAEVTRILFHALEEGLVRNRTKIFSTLREIEEDEALFDHVIGKFPGDGEITKQGLREHLRSIHLSTIEKFLSFENVGDFASKCTELLTYIFNHSTARLHPLFHPFSESFVRSLDLLSRSLMRDVVFEERASYFTFFRKYVMTCHTPFEGTPLRGLQVLGFLETRNLKFDRVFLLDANEDTLPDTRKDDTLLPFRAREILGLPTYLDRDKLAAYYFNTLAGGAKEVHLFFVESDTKERSRFVESLLWEKQKRDGTTDAARYLDTVQYGVKLGNEAPREIAKTEGVVRFLRGFTYSATALDRYLECPVRFYYSHVLGIDRKEEISGEIERADIGRFVHRAISGYFAERTGFPLKERDLDVEEMKRLADRLFSKEYGEGPAGALYLLKKQIIRRLQDLFTNYYLPLIREKTVTVVASEQNLRASFGPFSLKGRLDSMEKRGEKTYIIDYKTGSNPARLKIDFGRLDPDDRGSWNEAVGSLQLPFYLLLHSLQSGGGIRDMEGLFLLLGKASVDRGIELPLFGERDPEETFAVLKKVVSGLLEEIIDPAVPFRPGDDKKASCPVCDFRYLCGTQWIGKQA